MHKKSLRIGFVGILLFGILSLAASASAEENGYWTMKTDDEGRQVMIYTYTEPVEWVVDESVGYTDNDTQPEESVAEIGQASIRYASSSPVSGESAGTASKADPAGIIAAAAAVVGAVLSARWLWFIIKRKTPVLAKKQ